MSTTPILGLDELAPSQSQPEIIVNEALRILECVAQLNVADRDLNTAPGSPADGDRYIVGNNPTGTWFGQGQKIALYAGTDWLFIQPAVGWLAYVVDEDIYVKYMPGSPSGWAPYP